MIGFVEQTFVVPLAVRFPKHPELRHAPLAVNFSGVRYVPLAVRVLSILPRATGREHFVFSLATCHWP